MALPDAARRTSYICFTLCRSSALFWVGDDLAIAIGVLSAATVTMAAACANVRGPIRSAACLGALVAFGVAVAAVNKLADRYERKLKAFQECAKTPHSGSEEDN